jgi:hypothetical protein
VGVMRVPNPRSQSALGELLVDWAIDFGSKTHRSPTLVRSICGINGMSEPGEQGVSISSS